MKKSWIIAAVVIGLLALIYFGDIFSGSVSGSNGDPKIDKTGASSTTLKVITAKREYSKGKHIVSGVIDLPTPCHGLSVDTTIAESYPEQVALNFISTTTAEQCVQVVTPANFREEFSASGYAIIRAYWNGEPAKLLFTN
jgi:hypothetical protein